MIKLLDSGEYSLSETASNTLVLTLNGKQNFSWAKSQKGELLFSTKKNFKNLKKIRSGTYRLYDVENEKDLTGLQHLELFIEDGFWKGYLLSSGLKKDNSQTKIIATREIITKPLPSY